MIEEKTFKWVTSGDYAYERWLLVYEETERVLATIERYKVTTMVNDNLWFLHYQGKTETFLNKAAAMKYAEDAVKTPTCVYTPPSHYVYPPEGSTCKNCKGTGLHQEANDVSSCKHCKGMGIMQQPGIGDTTLTYTCPYCAGTGGIHD
jgi:hypothetical protein